MRKGAMRTLCGVLVLAAYMGQRQTADGESSAGVEVEKVAAAAEETVGGDVQLASWSEVAPEVMPLPMGDEDASPDGDEIVVPRVVVGPSDLATVKSVNSDDADDDDAPRIQPGPVRRSAKFHFRVTAYCDRGITAAGVPSGVGQCAAPEFIPFGSEIYVPALDRTFIVTDRTHERFRRTTVDLFMPAKSQCLKFGRRYTDCVVTYPHKAHRYGSRSILESVSAIRAREQGGDDRRAGVKPIVVASASRLQRTLGASADVFRGLPWTDELTALCPPGLPPAGVCRAVGRRDLTPTLVSAISPAGGWSVRGATLRRALDAPERF